MACLAAASRPRSFLSCTARQLQLEQQWLLVPHSSSALQLVGPTTQFQLQALQSGTVRLTRLRGPPQPDPQAAALVACLQAFFQGKAAKLEVAA